MLTVLLVLLLGISCVSAAFTTVTLEEDALVLSFQDSGDKVDFELQMRGPGWVSLLFTGVKEQGDAEDGIVVLNDAAYDGDVTVHSFVGTLETPGIADAGVLISDVSSAPRDGPEDHEWTRVYFSRPVHGCRQNGVEGGLGGEIPHGNVRINWARGNQLASLSQEDDTVFLTPVEANGMTSVWLLGAAGQTNPPDDPDLFTISITMDNVVHAETATTAYSCRFYEMPSENEVTVVGFRPPRNEVNLHHVSLFDCTDFVDLDKPIDLTSYPNCLAAPLSIQQCMYSGPMLVTVNKDGGNEYFSEDMGLSVGGDAGRRVYMLQVHTDKRIDAPEFTHSLGIDVVLTPNKRQHEAGMILVGSDYGQIYVPGLVENYPLAAYCPSDCTRSKFPPEGVTITAVMFHMHSYGVSSVLDVVRAGTGRVERIASNANFDYHRQDFEVLVEPVVVFPGDELVLSSNFTNDTPYLVVGSMATEDEMNMAFLRSYPRLDTAYCYSGFMDNFYSGSQTKLAEFVRSAHALDRSATSLKEINFRVAGVREIFDNIFATAADTMHGQEIYTVQCFEKRDHDALAPLSTVLDAKQPFVSHGACDAVTSKGLHNLAWTGGDVQDGIRDEDTGGSQVDEASSGVGTDAFGTGVAVLALLAVVFFVAGVAYLFKRHRTSYECAL